MGSDVLNVMRINLFYLFVSQVLDAEARIFLVSVAWLCIGTLPPLAEGRKKLTLRALSPSSAVVSITVRELPVRW